MKQVYRTGVKFQLIRFRFGDELGNVNNYLVTSASNLPGLGTVEDRMHGLKDQVWSIVNP